MRCCVLLFAVVALVVTVARADSYVLNNNSIAVNNVGFDGDVVDLRYVQYSFEPQPSITLNQSQVVGGGLKVAGYVAENPTTHKLVTVSFYDMYVTDATITLDGYMPHNTVMTFANISANLRNGKPLFILSSLHLHSQTSLIIQGVLAKWDAASSSGWVAQLTTTGERFTIQDGSGLFFLQVAMDSGAGVVSATTESGMLIADNSVFAVDYVSTRKNYEAVVSISQSVISGGSTFRITNVTNFEKPVLRATDSISVTDKSLFLLGPIDEYESDLFNISASITVTKHSTFTYYKINARATGLNVSIPNLSDDTSAVYGRNCTIAGNKLSKVGDYTDLYMRITKFVTDEGYEDNTKTCAYEQCTPTHYTTPATPRDKCACTCNGAYSAPTCSIAKDPVAQFTPSRYVSVCSVPNCKVCFSLLYKCTTCSGSYKLEDDFCVPNGPTPTTTTTTKKPDPPGPQPVPPHLCSEHCTSCVRSCYGCSDLMCIDCEPGYVVQGQTVCVKQHSGAHVTTALPATIGMLLLGAGAVYAV